MAAKKQRSEDKRAKEATALAAVLAFASSRADDLGCPRTRFLIESALAELADETKTRVDPRSTFASRLFSGRGGEALN